jgi:hypothetical protein
VGTAQEGLTAPRLVPWLSSLPIERRSTLTAIDLDLGPNNSIAISCGSHRHHARLDGSDFVLLDHDVEAELAMAVFGAELPDCLLYRAAWEIATGNGDTFLDEWAADADGDRLEAARDDWYGNYWESWPTSPAAARVLFGPRLQRRLAMVLAPSWINRRGADGPGGGWASARLAVAARARRAFVLSLAHVDAHRRPDALVPLHIAVTPEGEPSISGRLSRSGSAVSLRLPLRWLWDVWARDLPGGEVFVLEAWPDGSIAVVEWVPTGEAHGEHRPLVTRRHLEDERGKTAP